MSIDDRYQFIIKTKDVYQNPINIAHFVNKLKSIILFRQLKAFYKIKMLQL